MENPFHYGSVVTGDDFVDREKELEMLARDLRSNQRILLYSNRRMGKSSLLRELARRYKKEMIFAHLDLYGIQSRDRFLEKVVGEVSRATFTDFEKLISAVSDLIKGTRFRFVITSTGQPGVELDQTEIRFTDLAEVIDFPEKIAKKKGKRVVVILDEFQEILSFDGIQLLKLMRSRIQMHKHASYVFSGSKRHLLGQIFHEAEGAFYKSVRPFELGPIPKSAFEGFIVRKFEKAHGKISPRLARRVVDVGQGYPYYVQQIAHELFDMANKPTTNEEVDEAIRMAIEHQVPSFLVVWDSVKSPLQRRYLAAVAKEPGVGHGAEFIVKYGLKTYSHVQRVEKQLESRGIIEAGDIVDPMFALWLKNIGNTV